MLATVRGPAIVVLALVAGAAPVRAEPAQLVAARTAYAEGRQERTIALVTPLLPADVCLVRPARR